MALFDKIFGAGDRDRTDTASLEGWYSTIELHPQENLLRQLNFAISYFKNLRHAVLLVGSITTVIRPPRALPDTNFPCHKRQSLVGGAK